MSRNTYAVLTALLSLLVAGCGDDGRGGSDDVSGDPADASETTADVEDTDAVEDSDGSADADADAEGSGDAPTLPAPIVVERTDIPTSGLDAAVDVQLSATGGVPPYTWTLGLGDADHGRDDGLVLGGLPDGLTLGEDGRITGTTGSDEGLFYFVAEATDTTGASGRRMMAVRVAEDPDSMGPLRARAKAYQEVYDDRHLVHGFSYDLGFPGFGGPCNDFDAPCLSTLGDDTFVSGQCTMAMAFRAGTEPTEEHVATVSAQVDGWRFFERLVGVGGIVGRSFVHETDYVDASDLDPERLWPETEYRQGEGELSEWFWRGDTSRDQMTGAVLGLAAAHAFVDDEHVRAEAAAFLGALGDHILDNDLKIIDADGEVTTHGDLDGASFDGFPLGNGLNAVIVLAWLKVAHAATGEARFAEAYDRYLLEEEYIDILRDNMWVYSGYATKHYNTYMAFENFFHLMRLEEDPDLRERLRDIFRDTLWLNTDDFTPNRRGVREHNPVKTSWYLFSTGEQDEEALFHALWQLDHFPAPPLRDLYVDNSAVPDLVVNPDQPGESLYAMRSDQLPPDMVRWHRSTFKISGGREDGVERTGCDYMLPYWMGRYYGYIDADW